MMKKIFETIFCNWTTSIINGLFRYKLTDKDKKKDPVYSKDFRDTIN